MDGGISWPTLIGGLMLLAVVAGAGGKLIQNQFAALKDDLKVLREELERREQELKEQITKIHSELDRRRLEFIARHEFEMLLAMLNDRRNTQDEINKQAIDAYLSVKAWEAWKAERDKMIDRIYTQVDRLEHKN